VSAAPSLAEVLDAAVPFEVPLRMPFRGVTRRCGLLLHGPAGWGEFAPFEEYPPALAARWLAAAVEAAWTGWPAPVRGSVAVNRIVPAVPAGQVAALLAEDAEAPRSGAAAGASASSEGAAGAPGRGAEDAEAPRSGAAAGASASLEGAAGAPGRGAEDAEAPRSGAAAGASASSAAPTVKVKITGDFASDRDRVEAVRAAAGPAARIRLDVNAGWTPEQALRDLPELDRAASGLEYVEQPLESLPEMARLRAATGVPLAVDEALRLAHDPFDPALHDAVRAAADVVVLKVAPLGGVRPVLALAAALGMPVVVSGAMDTAVGLSAGVAAACALPVEPLACGFGTGRLLAADVTAEPLVPRNGRLAPVRFVPDPSALAAARARVTPEREQAWRARLVQAWQAGGAS
jgi:O-succinylbenzoate synthase